MIPMLSAPRFLGLGKGHLPEEADRVAHRYRVQLVNYVEPGTRSRAPGSRGSGAVKRAGLPEELNQHDLRHRRVTSWLAEGKPLALVQKAMGHSSIRVTEEYLHLISEDLLALVDDSQEADPRAMVEG